MVHDHDRARQFSVAFTGLTFACAALAWQDFAVSRGTEAHDPWSLVTGVLGRDFLVIDELNAPLLPLTAFLYALTVMATLSTKVRYFSFAWTLASEALALALLGCKEPCGVIALSAVGTLPPCFELRARQKPAGAFAWHMTVFVGLLVAGQAIVEE